MILVAEALRLQISSKWLADSFSNRNTLDTSYLSDRRIWLIAAIAILGIAIVGLQKPVSQDPAYHSFADQRQFFQIPNFWNVVSNLPFLAAAAAGLVAIRANACPGTLPALRKAYCCFFIGSSLIGFGSGYYHLSPNNATLQWDRFAMTIAFMAFLSIILGEHINPRWGQLSLLPLLGIGLLSVLVWRITEAQGHGDLRLYILVQFLPLILIPLVVMLFPSGLTGVYFIWGVQLFYAIGKMLELLDVPIYQALHISGHTLKHFAAAMGVFFVVFAVRKRKAVAIS